MTRARTKTRAPYFTATVDTEVEIDPSDLEDAGWVYVGSSSNASPAESEVVSVLRRWHDEEHDGAWRFCDQRPCIELSYLSGVLT